MTIEEAVRAARNNTPVIYESPMLGPMLYTRIGCIRKSYPLRRDAADGRAAEEYSLELLPMNGSRSLMVASPERVREATPEEIADIRQYTQSMKMPEVHPELLCEEIKSKLPHALRKEGRHESERKAGGDDLPADGGKDGAGDHGNQGSGHRMAQRAGL